VSEGGAGPIVPIAGFGFALERIFGGKDSNSARRDREAANEVQSLGWEGASTNSLTRLSWHGIPAAVEELARRAGRPPGPRPGAQEEARLPALPTFPSVPTLGIAEGERISSAGTGAIVPTTPGTPAWLGWLLQLLEILSQRIQRRGAAGIFIPQWLLDLARTHGIDLGGRVANVPATIPGDYYGTGPGIDWGDIVGANSWACRTLGIGCGNGGGGNGRGGQMQPFFPGFPSPTYEQFPGGQGPGLMPMNGAAAMGGGCPVSPFRAGASMAARAVPFVAVNPMSGKPVWFGPLGSPLLWSGDLRAVRRVRKIAGRAARFSGRRRRRGGR